MDKKKQKWLFIIAAIVLFVYVFNISNHKQAQACNEDKDCTCGLDYAGYSSCTNKVCDTTYCINTKPISDKLSGTWLFLKDNPIYLFTLMFLIILAISWPKI